MINVFMTFYVFFDKKINCFCFSQSIIVSFVKFEYSLKIGFNFVFTAEI